MNFGYGHLMFSSSQFFVLGAGTGSALQMYKFTFSNTLVDWANKISCSSGSWSAFLSESILSADGSTIYSFFLYGQNPFYAYFTGLSASNGGVTTSRYKSTGLVINLWGLALSGDYAVNQ